MKTHRPKQFKRQHKKVKGTRTERGYDNNWLRYRAAFLAANPLCQHCRRKAATQIDHIQAVTGADDPKFWLESNHAALCSSCHSRKTVRCDGGLGRPRQAPGRDKHPGGGPFLMESTTRTACVP